MLRIQIPTVVSHEALMAQAPKLAPSRLEVADLVLSREPERVNFQVSHVDHGLDGSVDGKLGWSSTKAVAIIAPVPALQSNGVVAFGRPRPENIGGWDSTAARDNNLVRTEELSLIHI